MDLLTYIKYGTIIVKVIEHRNLIYAGILLGSQAVIPVTKLAINSVCSVVSRCRCIVCEYNHGHDKPGIHE